LYRVHTTSDLAMLELLRTSLLEAGIPCYTKNENPVGAAMGEVPPLLNPPELWVAHAEDRKRALEVIKKRTVVIYDASGWTCSNCAETLEGQFTECWSCGTMRQ